MNRLTEIFDITIDKIINTDDMDLLTAAMKKIASKKNQGILNKEALVLYMICLEKKEYKLAKIIQSTLKDIHIELNSMNFLYIYNDKKKAVAELDYINYIDYEFKLHNFYCNENYDRCCFFDISSPLYHLVKTGCHKATEAYLDKAEIFEPLKDKMSYYIRIAAKNHDIKMLKLFADRKYTLRAFDMAYLMLYDNDYVNNTIIPMFYSQYSLDSVKLYLNIFSDTERLAVYIKHILYRLFPEEKLLYYRDNMLNISSININKIYYYVDELDDYMLLKSLKQLWSLYNFANHNLNEIVLDNKFIISPECCNKTLEVRQYNEFAINSRFFRDFEKKFFSLFSPEINIKKQVK